MKRTTLALLLPLGAALLATSSAAPAGQVVIGPPLACDSISFEPVLVYDVSGSTLLGPFYQHMAVYANGHATMSMLAPGLPTSDSDGKAAVAFVGPEEIEKLMRRLNGAGASINCDNPIQGADMPLTTITVMKGAMDSNAHTFSFWFADPSQASAAAIIQSFIAQHFPGF